MVLNKIIIILKWIFLGGSNSLEKTRLKTVLRIKAAKGTLASKISIRLI